MQLAIEVHIHTVHPHSFFELVQGNVHVWNQQTEINASETNQWLVPTRHNLRNFNIKIAYENC
jgi:hypothetical protein